MEEDWYPGGWFGPSWDAPVCDEDRHLDTPVGELCVDCLNPFTETDQGITMPFVYEVGSMSLLHEHRACFVKGITGVCT